MKLDDRAGLRPDERAELARRLDPLTTLGDLVAWGAEQTPKVQIIDVVVQDEFTHDVVVDLGDGRLLVYDST